MQPAGIAIIVLFVVLLASLVLTEWQEEINTRTLWTRIVIKMRLNQKKNNSQ